MDVAGGALPLERPRADIVSDLATLRSLLAEYVEGSDPSLIFPDAVADAVAEARPALRAHLEAAASKGGGDAMEAPRALSRLARGEFLELLAADAKLLLSTARAQLLSGLSTSLLSSFLVASFSLREGHSSLACRRHSSPPSTVSSPP